MMKGPASLAVERLKISEEAAAAPTKSSPAMTQEDTFDMTLLDQAAACVIEPFPRICWDSTDAVDLQDEYITHYSSPRQKKKLFFMSSQARRLKRRRRGSCDGYLVRCSEVFESLLRVNDGTTLEDVDNGDEHQSGAANRQRTSSTSSSKKTKRQHSNDSSDYSMSPYVLGEDENSPDPFP